MSGLSLEEKRALEGFFHPQGWFVSQKDLADLFAGHKLHQYDIDPDILNYREAYYPPTKADRIQAVWNACPNDVVAKLLLEILEIGFHQYEAEPPAEWIAGYENCKNILTSLQYRGDGELSPQLAASYFQNQKELVLKDWSDATLGIWICQYIFKDRQLANKLLEKYRQGLTVMLILQDSDYNRELQESHWDKMPCSVWWFPKTDGGINHHKFCIVDGQILWHGSFNFTWSAANKNQEEFTRDPNPQKVREFAAEFTRLRRVIDEEERVRREMNRPS